MLIATIMFPFPPIPSLPLQEIPPHIALPGSHQVKEPPALFSRITINESLGDHLSPGQARAFRRLFLQIFLAFFIFF